MSINSTEMVLWRIYMNPEDANRFRNEPDQFLDHFDLDPSEREMVRAIDPMGLIGKGANPLLVMMAWQTIYGLPRFGEYLGQVNQMN